MKTDREKLETLKKRQDKQNEYIKNNFDRVSVVMPKGYKELIASTGEKVNGFINNAIEKELTRHGLIPAAEQEPAADTEPEKYDSACPF